MLAAVSMLSPCGLGQYCVLAVGSCGEPLLQQLVMQYSVQILPLPPIKMDLLLQMLEKFPPKRGSNLNRIS